jgi:hypothetical protein
LFTEVLLFQRSVVMSRLLVRTAVAVAFAAACFGALATQSASASERAVVQYRLVKQKRIHVDGEKKAKAYHQSLKKLGCESKLGRHGGHFDLTFRCPKWRSAEFDTHKVAHQWQKWLTSLGFETAHKH